jgi:uncharacterized glyoxalase superfamily metalloenzyme YdcJ
MQDATRVTRIFEERFGVIGCGSHRELAWLVRV